MKDQGLPALTVVLTKLQRAAKFGGEGLQGLRRTARRRRVGRQRPVGVARRGSPLRRKVYRQEFARGKPTPTDLEKTGRPRRKRHDHRFLPDAEMFEEVEFTGRSSGACGRPPSSPPVSGSSSRTSAPAASRVEFKYDGGIRDFVSHVNHQEGPPPQARHLLRGRGRGRDVEVAMQCNTATSSRSSRSRTTSTRTRAARTCRASRLR